MRTPGIRLHKLALFGWAVVITAVLLLLSLPVLAGKQILPALNLSNCWEKLYCLTLSAETLISVPYYLFFRDYKTKFMCYKFYYSTLRSSSASLDRNAKNSQNKESFNPKLASYLAGLIEGDGTIVVPKTERSLKGKLNYASIQLVFDARDLALALIIQKTLGHGSIAKKKGLNAYILTINSNEGMTLLVNLINGYMRTPKIYALHRLIDWLNNKLDLTIEKKGLDNSPINHNNWLAGFIDADGHFSVRTSLTSKYPKIECKFELVFFCSENALDLEISKLVMKNIASFLEISDSSFKLEKSSKGFIFSIKTQNIQSNEILLNYLSYFPLFSTKYLDSQDFGLMFQILQKYHAKSKTGLKLDNEDLEFVNIIKNRMIDRTEFIWDHLNNFYNLHG